MGARTKSWMLMLLGAVAIVLLIACANVANLLLARATAREREVGIRAALGAGRWRLIRQLVVESLVLSITGTILAILVAWWAVRVLRTSMPDGVPRIAAIALDLRVLAAAAALSIITGILFGIDPALQLSKPDLAHALKEGARASGTGTARQRLRSALVVAEVALAVVLPLLPQVKSVVLAVLPDVPLRNVRTMEQVMAGRVAQRKFNMLLVSLVSVPGGRN